MPGEHFTWANPLKDDATNFAFLSSLEGGKMEMPSCNSNASARGLAKIAAMVACGGTFEGREYISPDIWKEMHEEDYTHGQLLTGFICTYTKGGMMKF